MLKICILFCLLATTLAFNLACTAECSAYYVCKAKGAWNGNTANCPYPQGCECRKFAWQKDDVASDFPKKRQICRNTAYGTICTARDDVESDEYAGPSTCFKTRYGVICRNPDQVESDWIVPALTFAGRAVAGGALSAAGKHAYDKFIRRRDSEESDIIPIALGAWKLYNALKKDSVESDAEFLGKLISKVKNVAGKVKGVVEKGKAVYSNGKNIFDSAKNIIGLFKKNKQDTAESDFLGALKLGFKAFKAIKGLKQKKQKQQPEADMLKDLIARLKDKIKAKLAKLKEKKAPKPAEEQADLTIDKCQICKAGCTLIKDESKRNLCTQACETFACKKD